jgi:hypothetical protein
MVETLNIYEHTIFRPFLLLRRLSLNAALAFIALITTDAPAQVVHAVVPPAPNSAAIAINKKAKLLNARNGGASHAFLYIDGISRTSAHWAAEQLQWVLAPERQGEVVGESEAGFERHAFLYSEGVMPI